MLFLLRQNEVFVTSEGKTSEHTIRRVMMALLFLLPLGKGFSQPQQNLLVRGTVIEDPGGSPVAYANVYIAGSTMGTATNEDGFFTIRDIPFRSFDIVVSHVAYQTVRKTIHGDGSPQLNLTIHLVQRDISIGEVNVTAKRPVEWEAQLKNFLPLFLGTSPFAVECEIQNPEVLDFTVEGSRFSAVAREPLVVNNFALGYRVIVALDSFVRDKWTTYPAMNVRFQKMIPTDEDEESQWTRNREEAYRGSLRHFLVSLVGDRLEDNSFSISLVTEQLRRRNLGMPVKAQDIVKKYTDDLWMLKYDYVLEVTCESKTVESRVDSRDHIQRMRPLLSLVQLVRDSVTVSRFGDLFPPFGVKVYGDWAKERIATLTPLDFVPEP